MDRNEPGKSMSLSLSKQLFLQKYLAEQSDIKKKSAKEKRMDMVQLETPLCIPLRNLEPKTRGGGLLEKTA